MVAPSSSSSSLNEPTKSIERISHRSSKCWPGGAPRSPRPPKPLPPSPPPQAPPPSSHDMSAEVSEMISIMTSSSSAPQAAGAATLKDAKREAMASLAPRTSAARTSKHHTDDKPIPKSKPPATSSTKASPQQRHWPPSRSPRPPRRAPPSPPQETPQLLSPTTVENAGVPSSPPRGTASLNLAAALAKDNAMNDSVIAALAKSPFETSSNPNPSGTSGNSGALAPSGTNTSSSRKSSSSSRGTTTSNSRGNITRLPMHPREQVLKKFIEKALKRFYGRCFKSYLKAQSDKSFLLGFLFQWATIKLFLCFDGTRSSWLLTCLFPPLDACAHP